MTTPLRLRLHSVHTLDDLQNKMNFSNQISIWLSSSLKEKEMDEVKAFSFNLIDNGGDFSVELIGASEFSEDDPDWACEEIWEANPRAIDIPEGIHENNWEKCLENMKRMISDFLDSGDLNAQALKEIEGIGIGFVDGDMDNSYTERGRSRRSSQRR